MTVQEMWIQVARDDFEAANLATFQHGHLCYVVKTGTVDPPASTDDLVTVEAHPELFIAPLVYKSGRLVMNWYCVTGIARLAAA